MPASGVKPARSQQGESAHLIALPAGLMIIVAIIVLFTHWPALSARALSFDDSQYLIDNHLVKNPSFSSTGRFITEVLKPSTVGGYYQPLTMISLMLDYALAGNTENLRPFHRMSLALHVFNTSLVIVLLYMLFGRAWPAAMLGLLFGVHPMTVETMPWVSERKTLLAAFFSLWSLVLYVHYTRTAGIKCYALCLTMYVLALMSKPTSTPLPALMLLLDYWPLGRLSLRGIWEKWPFFVIGGISAAITVVSQKHTVGVIMPGEYSSGWIPLALGHNIIFYLYKLVWPTNLIPYYPFPVPMSTAQPMVLAGIIGTCILIPALLFSLYWTRALLAGWLFFFIAIFPTMGVIGFTIGIAANKFAYLPAVGFLMIAAWLLTHVWNRPFLSYRSRLKHITVVAALLTLMVAEIRVSRKLLTHWQDTVGLYRHMQSVTPDFAQANNGLGMLLVNEGKIDEALTYLNRALQIDPRYDDAHYNLANALLQSGQIEEAFEHYSIAVKINPNYYKAYGNLGGIRLKEEKNAEAIDYFSKALSIKPDFPEALSNMGIALARMGQVDKAIEYYNKALEIDSDYTDAHCNLANALIKQGKTQEAIKEYQKTLQINPEHAIARKGLRAALAITEDKDWQPDHQADK